MFESTRKYLGAHAARFTFRKNIDSSKPLTDFFTGAKSVLIILPLGYEHALVAGTALKAIKTNSPGRHLTVVNSGTRGTPLADPGATEVIRIDPPDLNSFYLPRKPLLERILRRPYDVAVDLNLDFVLHTAYICRATGAPVRVGFGGPDPERYNLERFYNVQLQLDRNRTPQAMYEKLAEYLAMF
ncbi:MAG TPA: hypothetical protein VKS81_07935 [Bacteroidota bacterium]|nr:hypothetical protein [Bacteroidota bacterium]